MTKAQQKEILAHRKQRGYPLHAPPHFENGRQTYLLSAANYNHTDIMTTVQRRRELQMKLLATLDTNADADVVAWCVLPNHWHVLAQCDLAMVKPVIERLHNGTATQWNREDGKRGRKVWHRFSDRRIRNEGHYWATLNYVHANPVRHKCMERADQWETSSLADYLEEQGYQKMLERWKGYPIRGMGKGWDW